MPRCSEQCNPVGQGLAAATLLGAVVLAGRVGAQTAPDATDLEALKKLSVDQLMNVEVTSVSLFPEKLSETASAGGGKPSPRSP